jgi:myo-inositol-1(or 4)-monophosphatase
MEELAAFAEELARVARSETLYRWLEGCAAENKAPSGFDPVTDADRAAELAMRRLIAERFPDHGITGEEWPDEPGAGDLTWSLDPIDGTRSFICGLPTWTTLVALLDRGAPVLGLVDAPSLDETYIGFAGHAWMRRDQDRSLVRTSSCTRLSDARLSTTDPALFDPDSGAAFDRLRSAVRTVRYGHDGYAYARLAAGSLDLVVETGLKPHDYNALIPLVSGAGGAIGDWRGRHDYDGGRIIAASTPELFEAALSYFDDLA